MAISASGSYSLLGIDETKIVDMISAIDDYKAGIDEPLSQLSAKVDYAQGFKGSSIAETMQGYLEKVITEMKKMTAYIDEFSYSLGVVSANYSQKDFNISNQVSTDADAVEGKEVKTTTGVSEGI